MFDFGFSELVVIAIVLLVVVGPERLPRVARTAGHLFGRMQRYVTDVKADIQREMQLDELKKFQQQTRDLEQSLRAEIGEIQSETRKALSLPEDQASETSPAVEPPQWTDAVPGGDSGARDSAQEPQPGSGPEALALTTPVPETPAKPVDSV
ncbi:MAG: Sec-independent protein translocase protein TatB [Azoarcus sp.]|jgi:sec-independent protein translocase protein TatB|nr:Sec-independent protein translocase protein TatB [Azoarcus sp.]